MTTIFFWAFIWQISLSVFCDHLLLSFYSADLFVCLLLIVTTIFFWPCIWQIMSMRTRLHLAHLSTRTNLTLQAWTNLSIDLFDLISIHLIFDRISIHLRFSLQAGLSPEMCQMEWRPLPLLVSQKCDISLLSSRICTTQSMTHTPLEFHLCFQFSCSLVRQGSLNSINILPENFANNRTRMIVQLDSLCDSV